ncbi:MAG: FAD-dependent oxidoreductase, partial [Lentisphaeria bacterium]|nr:FAD-dependent oxidoreductase [Lentisphaeria bacterium]
MLNSLSFDCSCDVAVVGGGIAGVAAALQAARSGMKTILIEKTILTGGLATTGLVYFYLPLCDGNGRQVTFGITEELLRASLQYGPGDIPADWHEPGSGRRLQAVFSPAAFVLAMDEMLEKAGVEIWLDTLFCAAELAPDGSRITGIEVENKSGRGRIRAGQFIDASGDCSLARAAGIPCHDDNNFLALWALQYNQQHRNGPLAPELEMRLDGVPWDPATAPPGTIFRGIDGKKVTDFVLNGRRLLREYYRQSYQEGRTRQDLFAVKLP